MRPARFAAARKASGDKRRTLLLCFFFQVPQSLYFKMIMHMYAHTYIIYVIVCVRINIYIYTHDYVYIYIYIY